MYVVSDGSHHVSLALLTHCTHTAQSFDLVCLSPLVMGSAAVLLTTPHDMVVVLQDLTRRGQEYSRTIREGVPQEHYRSTTLHALCTSVTQRLSVVMKSLTDQQRVIRASLEFHQTYDKVRNGAGE